MPFSTTKSTKRFSFDISRNPTAKKAGSNTLTIATNPMDEGRYSYGGTQLTMTVREAQALRSFLNSNLDYPVDSIPVDSGNPSL